MKLRGLLLLLAVLLTGLLLRGLLGGGVETTSEVALPNAVEAVAEPNALPAAEGAAGVVRPAPLAEGRLTGRVVGEGAQSATVAVLGASLRRFVDASEGRFEIGGLPPGEYRLIATSGGRASEQLGPIPLGPGEVLSDLVLALGEGSVVAGRVIDARSQEGVVGAQLVAGGVVAASEANGRFLLKGLPPGTVELAVSHPGHTPLAVTLELGLGQRQKGLELSLVPAARVAGRVQLSDARPVVGVAVLALRYGFAAGEPPRLLSTTDEDGRFSGELPAGRWRLFAPTDSGEARSPELELAVGAERAGLILVVDIGGELSGRVLEPGGEPSVSAVVTVTELESQRALGVRSTDASGAFSFPNLPEGVYAVAAQSRGRTARNSGLRIGLAEQAKTTLHFGNGELSGRVVDGRGRALFDSTVSLVAAGGRSSEGASVPTDPEGRFRFQGVADEGAFTLRARHASGEAEVHGIRSGATDVELRITARSAIEGSVVDDEGHVVPSFQVAAEPQGGAGLARVTGSFASGRGLFRLEVAPGRYHLRVAAPGRVGGEVESVEAPASGSPPQVRVVLRSTRVIRGKVFDQKNGRPLGGARVATQSDLLFAFARAGGFRTGSYAVTEPDGTFTLADADRAEVTLFATAEGHGWSGNTRVPADHPTEQEVRVELMPGELGNREFAGVGMQIDPSFRIAVVFEAGPAAQAGVRVGDVLLTVDGTPVAGHGLQEVVGWIRGEVGTTTTLGVQRDGQALAVVAVRATIKF